MVSEIEDKIEDTMKNINYNIGIDVDGTLTKEIIGKETLKLDQSEVERAMLNCTPQNGIDILFENNYSNYIITGRPEMYRDTVADWLNMYGIPYHELIMFPKDFYIINGYDTSKYVDLKLDIHIQKDIHIALDDKDEVIKALNDSGIVACKVKDDFKEAFEKVLRLKERSLKETVFPQINIKEKIAIINRI